MTSSGQVGATGTGDLALLRQMLLIRRFEEKCVELYSAGNIRGFMHLYIGEEAIAAGVISGLAPEDAVVSTYREHGHALSRGLSASSIMAEMYGKVEGCARGRGGSMHLFDAATRFYGGNAIVGGGLPIAVGLGLADAMRGLNRVTCCFFGEGAAAEGEFHESLNLAKLWKLPVLFICENNLYAMGTRLERSESQVDILRHAHSYDMAGERVDGMDVRAVAAASAKATDHVRSGQGPYFLECMTYRFRAHSMFDAELYRTKAEVEEWRRRDPLVLFLGVLEAEGILAPGVLDEMEREVGRVIAEAVEAAEAGHWEPVEGLTQDVYTEPAEIAS